MTQTIQSTDTHKAQSASNTDASASVPVLKESVVNLAKRLRSRELTAVQVVQAHIERIEAVNCSLNAVVQKTYDQARQEAREADVLLDSGRTDLPPFLGVPCTIKEHYAVAGLPNTGGLLSRRNVRQDKDAILVSRMREAGFILLGTTNVPEALMWYESYNKVYGRTTNAYDAGRTPGGSSGGEGAIIGAGGSPIGLGGDIGGSIRLPAFFNGVVGHKPSGGRVPETGCWPGTKGVIGRYKVCGPLARRVEDLKAVMPILAGADGVDQTADGPDWGTSPDYQNKDITVYYFDDNGWTSPRREIKDAVRRSVASLKARGFKTEPWRPPSVKRGPFIWANALAHAGGNRFEDSLNDGPGNIDLLRQWAKWPFRRADHIFPSLALATIERLIAKFPKAGKAMADERVVLQREIEDKLGDDGVLLLPVFHRTAPKHGLDSLLHFFGFAYCGMLNPLELPATAVPTGLADGLPTGVQIAGRRNADHLTLHVAGELEAGLGGWQPPF